MDHILSLQKVNRSHLSQQMVSHRMVHSLNLLNLLNHQKEHMAHSLSLLSHQKVHMGHIL